MEGNAYDAIPRNASRTIILWAFVKSMRYVLPLGSPQPKSTEPSPPAAGPQPVVNARKVLHPSRIAKADVAIEDASRVHFNQEVSIGQLSANHFQVITERSYEILECEHHVPKPGAPLVFRDFRRKAMW